ncbi:MAG: DUF4149 domain-containing protein [Gammaproteobacteria bacterium]|mgnify:FL=1|jgi:hypothetical protein|nr:MAG: hypothetical protein AMJ59_19590 [Gammaproteobacteria bacterium SG8_31]
MRIGERLIQTLWVGAIWTTGYIVAPSLFEHLDDRATAGRVAGELFTIVTWLSMICGALLLVAMVRLKGGRQKRLRAVLIVSIMFLLALGEWLVRPMMEAARLPDGTPGEGFAALHGVSAVLYLLASLACVFLVAARIPSVTAAADE